MLAVQQTVRQFSIPAEPFLDLISAFEQDRRMSRYQTLEELLDYAGRSANPVGRLVLYMCGYQDARGRSWRTRRARGCSWRISGRT